MLAWSQDKRLRTFSTYCKTAYRTLANVGILGISPMLVLRGLSLYSLPDASLLAYSLTSAFCQNAGCGTEDDYYGIEENWTNGCPSWPLYFQYLEPWA